MNRDQFKKQGRYSRLLWPALIMLVSACTTTDHGTQGYGPKNVPPKWDGITPMTLTIVGEESNIRLASRKQLRDGIKDFAENNNPQNTGQLIAQLRSSNMNPTKNAPGFTGVGGALGHAVLDVAEEALSPAGQYDQQGKRVVVSMEGQIKGYEFSGSVGNPGNGKLVVITAITSRVVRSGPGNLPPPKTVGYKWDIEVINNGFKVVEYDSTDPKDPFPETMTFSQNMLNRIKSLGFQYKLWAKGTDIIVKSVWRKQNFDWQNVDRPNYWGNPLPNPSQGHNKWKRLYESDSASCIDMMFVDPPPPTFNDLQGPPWYCLGRCAHPSIINSR